MVNMNDLVPADTLPLDRDRPLCHPAKDKWGSVSSQNANGTVTVIWNDGSRATTKPLGWFRRRPAPAPVSFRPPAPPNPLPAPEVRFQVKLDGVPVGSSVGTLQTAETFATSVKRNNLRKEVRVEELTVTRRTVAFADRKGQGAVIVHVNGKGA